MEVTEDTANIKDTVIPHGSTNSRMNCLSSTGLSVKLSHSSLKDCARRPKINNIRAFKNIFFQCILKPNVFTIFTFCDSRYWLFVSKLSCVSVVQSHSFCFSIPASNLVFGFIEDVSSIIERSKCLMLILSES